MCTLTLLRDRRRTALTGPHPLWRIVFNRDEQRSREQGSPPALLLCGAVRTLHPVDPQGGGTWIAAAERGLVLALLNGADTTSSADDPAPRRSRGEIIPGLAAAAARRAASAPVDDIDPTRYRPFDLVIADDHEIIEVISDGHTLARAPACSDEWLMRTSSSFASDAVCAWRRRLFASIATPVSARDQDAFHAHAEPDRPAFGVAMTRPDACTVSTTTVDVFAGAMRMTYRSLSGAGGVWVTEIPSLA